MDEQDSHGGMRSSGFVIRYDEFHLAFLEGDFRDAFQRDSDFPVDGFFQGGTDMLKCLVQIGIGVIGDDTDDNGRI